MLPLSYELPSSIWTNAWLTRAISLMRSSPSFLRRLNWLNHVCPSFDLHSIQPSSSPFIRCICKLTYRCVDLAMCLSLIVLVNRYSSVMFHLESSIYINWYIRPLRFDSGLFFCLSWSCISLTHSNIFTSNKRWVYDICHNATKVSPFTSTTNPSSQARRRYTIGRASTSSTASPTNSSRSHQYSITLWSFCCISNLEILESGVVKRRLGLSRGSLRKIQRPDSVAITENCGHKRNLNRNNG